MSHIVGIVVRSKLIAFKMMSLEEVLSSVVREFAKYCREFTIRDGYEQPELVHSPRCALYICIQLIYIHI